MDVVTLTELITTLGFPIACVIGMGYFIVSIVKRLDDNNQKNLESIQERSNERENKLYAAIAEQRIVNEKAITAIAQYVEKLDAIQSDVNDIKVNIAVLAGKSKDTN